MRVLIRKGKKVVALGLLRSKERESGTGLVLEDTPRLGPVSFLSDAIRVGVMQCFHQNTFNKEWHSHEKILLFVYFICLEKLSKCYAKHHFFIS